MAGPHDLLIEESDTLHHRFAYVERFCVKWQYFKIDEEISMSSQASDAEYGDEHRFPFQRGRRDRVPLP